MSGTIVNDYTLGANSDLDIPVGETYTNLLVNEGFDNIYDYGTIDGLTTTASIAADVYIEAGASLNGGNIQNNSGADTFLNISGTESGLELGTGAYVRVESGGQETKDTLENGGQIDITGGNATDILVQANGLLHNNSGTLSYSTLEAGGILNMTGGTGVDNVVESGATAEIYFGGIDSNPLIYGSEIATGSTTLPGTIDGATINSGTLEIESASTLSGNISFSGTGGLLGIGSAATILSGTEITGLAPGDTIILEGVTGSAIFNTTSGILTVSSTDLQFAGVSAAETFVSTAVTVSGTASTEITIIDNAECFLAGTRIMTPHGAVVVENLELGDEVLTAAGKAELIEWIGQRSYDVRFAVKNHLVRPVCITADALAAGVPARDLYVSPGHGIFIDGVLVPAWRLINGKTITQPEIMHPEISYYHIELASHAVIMAENCPAETYLDIGSRSQFQNAATCGNHAAAPATPLPRVECGFALETIKAKLNARAGVETTSENTASAVTGHVERVGLNTVSGWVLCPDDPETPVCLDVYFWLAGTLNRKRELANIFRSDLRNAGLGSGCHGFAVELPEGATGIRVLRAANRMPLALTETATKVLVAA